MMARYFGWIRISAGKLTQMAEDVVSFVKFFGPIRLQGGFQ